MSVSRGCLVIERHPDQWFCVVAVDEYDYDFQNFNLYGPHKTPDAAYEEMHRHEANPGSHSEIHYERITARHIRLVGEGLAQRAERHDRGRGFWRDFP